MLRWGTHQLCWQLMKHSILTVAALASNNATPIYLLRMVCSTKLLWCHFTVHLLQRIMCRQTRNPWVRCGEILCYRNWWIFKYLVNGLSAHCKMEEINISMDRCFTSVSLASWALEKSITIIGTMRHSRIDIPKELKSVANIEEKSVM